MGFAGIIGQYQIDWGLLLAGAVLATVPVVMLFGIVGRWFIAGLTAGAVKRQKPRRMAGLSRSGHERAGQARRAVRA